jgi:lipid II:glycine glycyltransferase (peptidoglycan interpeptide bridge formation enzyme)
VKSLPNFQLQLAPLPHLGDNFLQSPFWANFKGDFGWTPLSFMYTWQQHSGYFLVLVRRIAKIFSLAYVAFPSFDHMESEQRQLFLQACSQELQGFLPTSTLFVRWDLSWQNTYMTAPFHKAVMDIQPPDTTVLDLHSSIDQLLANMHKKTRYNIGLAQKKDVHVYQAPLDDLPRWYQLYQETAQRDGIAIHSLTYYQKFINIARNTPHGPEVRLYLAKHEDDIIAGIITLFYGSYATYVYGASGALKRNLMPNYALQWHAIVDAKAYGCQYYDFFGIPPSDDPQHPMAGLYQFKMGFGGTAIHRTGCYDYAYSKLFYRLYTWAERYRKYKKDRNKPPYSASKAAKAT